MMLFPAVLMNFPNSDVCLIGEGPLQAGLTISSKAKFAYDRNCPVSSIDIWSENSRPKS